MRKTVQFVIRLIKNVHIIYLALADEISVILCGLCALSSAAVSFYIAGVPGCQSLFKEWPSFLLCPRRIQAALSHHHIKEIDSLGLLVGVYYV